MIKFEFWNWVGSIRLDDMESYKTNKRRIRVKLIFNPGSGDTNESPLQLMDIIKEMQAWKYVPEAYLLEKGGDLNSVVRDAISRGISMFVACGGDGTVSAVARAVVGTNAILGIIPTGTQNNIALSLGIPTDIPAAIAILGTGRRLKTDVGIVTCGVTTTPFIEICSLGLLSSLFSAGDDIQHGNIAQIGSFITTLVTFPPSDMRLILDDKQDIQNKGHMVLITNMPYVARHYKVGNRDSFRDGLLDVLNFAEMSKFTLVSQFLQGSDNSMLEDHQIQHFRVRKVEIYTHPAMTVMADGVKLGEGLARVEVRPRALSVIIGPSVSNKVAERGENHEI